MAPTPRGKFRSLLILHNAFVRSLKENFAEHAASKAFTPGLRKNGKQDSTPMRKKARVSFKKKIGANETPSCQYCRVGRRNAEVCRSLINVVDRRRLEMSDVMTPTKCPYCAEEIQAEAIKCKHCGCWLTGDPNVGSAVSSAYGQVATPGPISSRRLSRSTSDRMLAGVCGGLGQYFGIDATLVRILFALFAFFSVFAPAVAVYIIMIYVVPNDDALIH